MRKSFSMALLAAALCLPAAAQDAPPKCQLVRFVALPITFDSVGRVTVPIKIEDQYQNLLVDTGGAFSMLTESTVSRLKLTSLRMPSVRVRGFGGAVADHYVVSKSMEIAGVSLKDKQFVVLPDNQQAGDIDGILAPDLLQVFDVDFDFASGKLSLFSQQHCEGRVVYWTQEPYAQIPFKLDEDKHMKIEVVLDGEDVPAVLDTGAFSSVMSLDTAARLFKLNEDAVKKNDYSYPFKKLMLQGGTAEQSVTVNNPDIILVPDEASRIMGGYQQPKLILGMSVLRQLHLYIAYKEKNIYVTAASAR